MRYFNSPDPRDKHFVGDDLAHEKIAAYVASRQWDYFCGVHFETPGLDLTVSLALNDMAREKAGDGTDGDALLESLASAFREEASYLAESPPGQLRCLMADDYVHLAIHEGEVYVACSPFFPDPHLERLRQFGEEDPPEPPDIGGLATS